MPDIHTYTHLIPTITYVQEVERIGAASTLPEPPFAWTFFYLFFDQVSATTHTSHSES